MFYKIFAIFMLFSTAVFAQPVTSCNAFGAKGIACDETPVVENFEIIGETKYQINPPKTISGSTACPSDDPNCGPKFRRNAPCDGSTCGPIFKRNEGCDNCEPEIIQEKVYVKNYTPIVDLNYNYIHRKCKDFAPIHFSYIDFRIKDESRFSNYINKLGDYRFRIFGCRRNDKEMFLNVGRTMQKDMDFFDIYNKVYGDCIPQQKMPKDLCDPNSKNPMPEYILTAEITDYAMNVCDEFDWRNAKNKEKRKGTSEMTIVWRLTDIAKENVFWKGTSTGYAELENGTIDGEVVLVEKAFEDALSQLRYLEGFEEQITTRHTPEETFKFKTALAELERQINPAKCEYQEEIIAQTQTLACSTCPNCPVFVSGVNESGNLCFVSAVDISKNTQSIFADPKDVDYKNLYLTGETKEGGICYASIEEISQSTQGYINSQGGVDFKGASSVAVSTKNGICYIPTDKITENAGVIYDGEKITDFGGFVSVAKSDSGDICFVPIAEITENAGLIYNNQTVSETGATASSGNACYITTQGQFVEEIKEVAELSNACTKENGCGPIFERNKPCDGSTCGPVFERNGGCDGDECGPIFKRNENCESLACRLFSKEEDEINEASGVDIFGNVDNVRVVEREWIDIPITKEQQQVVETMFMESKGEFCIENELVYKEMNPFNVYKTRASIVEISSLSGSKKGVGLIINDQFILTSADMISKEENTFKAKTINGVEFMANGFRFSPNKNVALLLTQEPIKYTPLPLNLELPQIGASGFLTLGIDIHKDGGEGYVDNTTTIKGYRFSEEKGAEIITDQHSQSLTVGGALVDDKGNIYGMAHYGKKQIDEPDIYIPIEEALKSLNLELCGRDFLNQKPWQKSTVETKRFKAPEQMIEKERK